MKKFTVALALAAVLSAAVPTFAQTTSESTAIPTQCTQSDGILVSDAAGILVSDLVSPGILVSDLAGILVSDAVGCPQGNGILVSD